MVDVELVFESQEPKLVDSPQLKISEKLVYNYKTSQKELGISLSQIKDVNY